MCKHRKIQINDVTVCTKCGLTVDKNGKIIGIDKKLRSVKTNAKK